MKDIESIIWYLTLEIYIYELSNIAAPNTCYMLVVL